MKKNLTELVFIIDCSGSMHGLEKDTIGGYNSFLDQQRDAEGEVLVSTVMFNHRSSVVHDRIPLNKVKDITSADYRTSGSTALFDAIGNAVHHIGNVHKYIREEDVPEKTIFVITTDGMENASRDYDDVSLKKLIEKKKKLGWEFLFLGANIDSAQTAARFGVDEDHAVNYNCDEKGINLFYNEVGSTVKQMRACSAPLDASWKANIEKDYKNRKKK